MCRLPVWEKTIQLTNLHPFAGWGISTYKIVFPVLGKSSYVGAPFLHAHNDWLQVLFETGYIGFAFMVIVFGYIFYKLLKTDKWLMIIGLLIISLDMCVHFPMRGLYAVPLITLFFAFCEKEINA
jgi:O-antigen ligase